MSSVISLNHESRDRRKVGDFLGIRIVKEEPGKFHLTQTSLIEKVLQVSGIENCTKARTPASTTHLGIDKEGEQFQEDWDYASVVQISMYLGNNSCLDIAFAVNQYARFTHCPKESHVIGTKRILRYLYGIRTKGMYTKHS